MISHDIEKYIEDLIPNRSPLIIEMEAYARSNGIPIMELVGIEALIQILKIHQPKRILEIGTAIGYSAIRFASSLPNAQVVTIERDEERLTKAYEYIKRAECSNQIEVLSGDALLLSEELTVRPAFDVLFIDAAKGQYQRFFQLYESMVRPGGIIISDNVLFRGFVAVEPEEKRLKGIAKKINSYNEWLMQQSHFETTFFPVGDGVAISIKK